MSAGRHAVKVSAEIAPYLRDGEEYRYRGLCYWVRSATGERVAVMYGYITSERFMLVDDTTRARISGHDLDALLDVDRDGKNLVLYFVTDEESKQAASVGLHFTSRRLTDEFLGRLLLAYQRRAGKTFKL